MDGGCVHDMALAQEIYDDRLVDPLAGSVRLRCGVAGCGFGRVPSSDAAHDRKRVSRAASGGCPLFGARRSEEHTAARQSLMRKPSADLRSIKQTSCTEYRH